MRTATIRINQNTLFDCLGLRDFWGKIESTEYDIEMAGGGGLIIKIIGEDDRLPDRVDYPKSVLIAKTVQCHFEVLE